MDRRVREFRKLARLRRGRTYSPELKRLAVEYAQEAVRSGVSVWPISKELGVWFQTLQLSWGFAESLKPEDYCAVVAYDIRPEILTDFTTDKMKVREGLDRLKIAAFSEAVFVSRATAPSVVLALTKLMLASDTLFVLMNSAPRPVMF